MIYTIDDIFFSDKINRLLNHRSMAILNYACKFLSPKSSKLLFNFRKNKLNWVVFRAIWYIKYPSKAQSFHFIFRFFTLMGRKIIHKQSNFFITTQLSKFLKILFLDINRVIIYSKMLLSIFF